MNPLTKVENNICSKINCDVNNCRFEHRRHGEKGSDQGQPTTGICCPHEWEITLNYPGRYKSGDAL